MNPNRNLTIVLLGKSGTGKSSSGNTILGQTKFESKQSPSPVTRIIHEGRRRLYGRTIKVVDTPGILGNNVAVRTVKNFCQRLLRSSRPCLFLVVLRVGPFSDEDKNALRVAQQILGENGMRKSYLLFTGGDTLEDMSLDDFIHGDENEEGLPSAIRMFAGAYHLFNNQTDDEEQVRKLLQKSGHLRSHEVPDHPADDSRDRRIVLFGLPGKGKSASGNTILGSKKFDSRGDFNAVSESTTAETATVEGRRITVVDTPGFSNEVLSPEQLVEQMQIASVMARPGPHAFVFVISIGRVEAADVKLYELLKLFQSDTCDVKKYSMVLFTHGDKLESSSIGELIESTEHVSELVNSCGGRYCVFHNGARRNREQVRNLLSKIDEMVSANGGQHFTSELFRMAETYAREIRNMSGSTSEPVYEIILKKMTQFLDNHKWKIIIGLALGMFVGGVGCYIACKTGAAVGAAVGGALGAGAGAAVGMYQDST